MKKTLKTPDKAKSRRDKAKSVDFTKKEKADASTPAKRSKSLRRAEDRVKRMFLKLGDIIELEGAKKAELKFIGETEFGSGTWYGVELLDNEKGKNSGSVKGVDYFKCSRKGAGLFITAEKIREKLKSGSKKVEKPARSPPSLSTRSSSRDRKSKLKERKKGSRSKSSPNMTKSKLSDLKKASVEAKEPKAKPSAKAKRAIKDLTADEARVKKLGIVVGDDVEITRGRVGTVMYIGQVEGKSFRSDCLYFGLRFIDGSLGNATGIVGNNEYFNVPKSRGVWTTADRIRRKVKLTQTQTYEKKIKAIYEKHNPSKISVVPRLVADTDSVPDLYLRICRKYGVQPEKIS